MSPFCLHQFGTILYYTCKKLRAFINKLSQKISPYEFLSAQTQTEIFFTSNLTYAKSTFSQDVTKSMLKYVNLYHYVSSSKKVLKVSYITSPEVIKCNSRYHYVFNSDPLLLVYIKTSTVAVNCCKSVLYRLKQRSSEVSLF